ncbi:unnamed protein product [Arctogadus glacialis]
MGAPVDGGVVVRSQRSGEEEVWESGGGIQREGVMWSHDHSSGGIPLALLFVDGVLGCRGDGWQSSSRRPVLTLDRLSEAADSLGGGARGGRGQGGRGQGG